MARLRSPQAFVRHRFARPSRASQQTRRRIGRWRMFCGMGADQGDRSPIARSGCRADHRRASPQALIAVPPCTTSRVRQIFMDSATTACRGPREH